VSPAAAKQRLDALVVERGLAESRARAQALIMGGAISVDGRVVTRPSYLADPAAELRRLTEEMPYVSRGGLKLRHALDRFRVEVAGRVAADVGASTGGFTDVLLQAGAARVYAIDVGYGQLDWGLRNDPRVVVLERTNIRALERLPEPVDLATVDVSFISLRQVLPHLRALLGPDGDVLALIKPQFEAGRGRVGRKGVVRDPGVWRDVIREVLTAAEGLGFHVRGLERSPIRGPAGNVEFLAHLSLRPGPQTDDLGRRIADLTE
jgi:23S rRNA (cytidine1920-2'-O)/16S rRNA (cytidine1409-2'-O)-methyltransferase